MRSTARMADDAPWRPAGAPDAVDGVAAQLHRSSMDTSPSATERLKRVISPEGSDRYKRLDSRPTPKKAPRAEMQLVTPQRREDENAARRLWRALPGDLVLQLMAKVAEHKARFRDKEQAEYVAQCAMLGLAVVAAPPLPDGATEADRERLEDAALEALYGD